MFGTFVNNLFADPHTLTITIGLYILCLPWIIRNHKHQVKKEKEYWPYIRKLSRQRRR